MVSMTARAAAQEIGLPPKVVPWLPGSNIVAARPKPIRAPIGTPPPSPLASVSRSGVTPEAWLASHEPVRPIPDWTSSNHSSAPWRSVISRAATRNSGDATLTPASPWSGSITTAAVSSVTAAASASASPNGTQVTSPGSGSNGSR